MSAKGTVKLLALNGSSERTVKLSNTLHVPELRSNLLSVAKMTDAGTTVQFYVDHVEVRNLLSNKLIFTANRAGDLYYMNEANEEKPLAASQKEESVLKKWHERLRHLNVKDVLEMSQKNLVSGVDVISEKCISPCNTCREGKFISLPVPKKSNRKTKVLEIGHTDVCGPMRTESRCKKRYFVTFIDDCSRWCEIYFLRNKSDAFEAFKM